MIFRRKLRKDQRVEVRFVHERWVAESAEYVETAVPEWLKGTFVEYDESGNRVVEMDDGRRMFFNRYWKIRPLNPGLFDRLFYYR